MRSADNADRARLNASLLREASYLRRIVKRLLTRRSQDHDDVVQDTWVRLLGYSGDNVKNPRAFIYRVSEHIVHDIYRSDRSKRFYQNISPCSECKLSYPQQFQEQEIGLLLEQVIASLPEPIRDVFVLSRFEHMTNRDIAEHLGISVKTVELRISKALKQCTAMLRD